MREKTKKRRPDEYSFQRNIHGYLLIAPAILAILLLSVYPLLQGIWISLLNYDMTKANAPNFGTFAGLKNYLVVFANSKYRNAVMNSVVWTLVNIVIQLALAMGVALILNEKLKGRGVFRTMALLPWAIPAAISALTYENWCLQCNSDSPRNPEGGIFFPRKCHERDAGGYRRKCVEEHAVSDDLYSCSPSGRILRYV